MAGSGRKNADDAIALAIATGKTTAEAAAASGVSERTVTRRLTDRAFLIRVSQLKNELIRMAVGRLTDSLCESVDVLRALLSHPDAHVRHKSAVKLVELTLKVEDLARLRTRNTRLRQKLVETISTPKASGGTTISMQELIREASNAGQKAAREYVAPPETLPPELPSTLAPDPDEEPTCE